MGNWFRTLRKQQSQRRLARKRQRALAARLNSEPRVSRQQVKTLFARFEPFACGHDLIRIGGAADGGYLLPDDLEGISACFSPGVDYTVSFDLEMAQRGIRSRMADASVDGIGSDHPLLTFEKLFIGPETSGNVTSMSDWINRLEPGQADLLLQMDIEGAEYDALLAMDSKDLARFRIIALELHDLEEAFFPEGHARITAFMDRLQEHFVICHLHPNNFYAPVHLDGIAFPSLLELTLLRRDRLRADPTAVTLPHKLDAPNVPDKPDWICPPFWRG